jgi:ABC-type lipoprotein release transport system permease subunit
MLILRIAWRSFMRHKRRSIITASAIAFGLALLLVSIGLNTDAHNKMADMGIRMGSGHVVVQGKGFLDEQTLDYTVPDPGALIAAAEGMDHVVTVLPRVQASGLLAAGGSSAAVAIAGVDPQKEPAISLIAAGKRRVKGEYLRPTDELTFKSQPADIYIGAVLANTLELDIDDRVVLTVSPRGGERPSSAAFLVRGVFRTGLDELDGFYVEVPIDAAQRLFHLGDDVTQVAVHLDSLDATGPATRELRRRLAGHDHVEGLDILPWQEALVELYEAIVFDDAGSYFMMAIIFVLVAIGIFNTVLMSVIERTREFGVMMALGTSKGRMFSMVMTEAVILAIAASLLGLGLGLGIHTYFATHGLDLSNLYGDIEFAGVLVEGQLYSDLPANEVMKWTVAVIAIVLVSALYPALRATRLDPVEAMRHA